ncbi:unnamed protein product, partial [Symbiodinium necroappetens]
GNGPATECNGGVYVNEERRRGACEARNLWLSETSCIDVGDWLHSLENPMGDLSNSSATWWREVLLCLDRFYAAYLKSSNLAKLSLKPEAFASSVIKEDKWLRVDKRATSMLLGSLPESVRTEILASRLTGALQVLGRVMVLYRPGSTAERQQILKALELPATAATAAEAVDALRRWARWLRRASDVGLQSPDPSILLRGLDNMVKRVLQDNSEILFRVNMMRYNLEVDVKPTQRAVEDLHQALLSEFEQVAFRGRAKATATPSAKAMMATPASPAPSAQASGDASGEAVSPKGKNTPCKFFLSDQGCRRGAACKYSHEVDRKQKQGRCWTCGSKQHVSKACPTKDKQAGGRSPTRSTTTKQEGLTTATTLAAMAPENAHPSPTIPTGPPSSTASSAATPAASTTTASENTPAAQPPEDDIRSLLKEANNMLKEMRQLKMLTVGDVLASATEMGMSSEGERTGLLDSGASHPYRSGTDEEFSAATTVRVQLATGEEVALAQSPTGTLLAKKASPEDMVSPIVPLGSLVQELNCELTWGRRSLWSWDQGCQWSRHLEAFLDDGTRANQLLAMEAAGSPFENLSPAVKGVLAEDMVLDDKVLEDGAILVEMDIVRSKSFDLRRSSGAYRALVWAAATGRVKGVLASPPSRTKMDDELIAKTMWFSLVAKAACIVQAKPPPFVMIEGKKLMGYLEKTAEDAAPMGIQTTWSRFLEIMWLERTGEFMVTNLDYESPATTTTTSAGRWTATFKEETIKAINKWFWAPESRQRAKWMARMDAGSFLESLSNKELEQWRVHLRNNHVPYNRKCRTCVESSATGRKHVRIKTPSSYCSSLDVCGPFRHKGADPDHADYRFALGPTLFQGSKAKYEMGVHTEAKYEMGVHTEAKYEMGVHTKVKYEMGVHTEVKYEMG